MKMKNHFFLKAVFASLFLFIGVVAVQAYQLLKVCDEQRNAAINEWAKQNHGSEQILAAYHECAPGMASISDSTAPKKQLFTFTECAIMAGSQSLADAIEKSTIDVTVPIPLRWL